MFCAESQLKIVHIWDLIPARKTDVVLRLYFYDFRKNIFLPLKMAN